MDLIAWNETRQGICHEEAKHGVSTIDEEGVSLHASEPSAFTLGGKHGHEVEHHNYADDDIERIDMVTPPSFPAVEA